MNTALVAVTLITAVGCGVNAGVFFAFSSFVMRALAELRPAQGIAAMQSINVRAVTPLFMSALLGTAVGCVVVAAWAVADWPGASGPYLLAGSGLYLVGTLGVTTAYHVPRNDRLATLRPESAEAAHAWRSYLSEWTAANHLRAAAALAASVADMLALVVT